MPELFFGKTCHAMEKAIRIAQRINLYISIKINKITTLGYTAKDVDFKSELARALETNRSLDIEKTDQRQISFQNDGRQIIDRFEEQGDWNGYNRVNIDKEMTKLMQNNLTYRSAVEALLRKITLLTEVIEEGGQ